MPGLATTMASTTIFRRGQVVVVEVTFTGQGGSKPRPALVISADTFHKKLLDVIVCPISSQPRYFAKPGAGDVPLKAWAKVGLRHPSTARLSNLVAVEKSLIRRVIGTMPADDLLRVLAALRKVFGL